MNQLEFFVGSSDVARADILRYLRLLRELDQQIEYHLSRLRALATEGSSPSASPRGSPSPDRSSSLNRTISGRKRRRESPCRRRGDFGAPEGGEEQSTADLYAVHQALVRRHCEERENIAAELLERSKELKVSLSSRMTHLSQILQTEKKTARSRQE